MRIHRIGAAIAAAAFALTAAACGGSSDEGQGGDQPYLAIVSKGFQHQFWQAVKQGAEQEAAEQGIRISFEGPASESEVEAQVTMLQNALGRQPDVLGFAALDSRAAAPLLQQARAQNIPVIAFDSGVDSDIPLTTAATNNKAAAAEAAKHMAEAIGGTGKVALVVHDQTSKSGADRRDGFIEWMQANAPGIEVLEPQYGGGDQAKSADITKAIIAANPDLKGIYGANEGSAIGVIRGVQESGAQGLAIVGFDSGSGQIEAIRNGQMLGAVTQDPIGMGRALVDAAVKAINGEPLPPVIDTGFYWYDQSNIDSDQIRPLLYE
ncbi:MAG TPA: ABC transporter substrate-binding protein [Pseudonocardia sp.]|jgi:ribose transport system substrate-binding protein|uniref:ABC transporter substrate-binding protein n=1 Tax=Pseudonocardia sp. TaxID=60912 RepID=UPI002B4B1C82|nr:ABC transporter substrate-binding protein [Pseudonocardia sp.]HLU58700.1 ABC transporter substrate-binding protein [Pseudonocardia sp.]